MNIRALTTKDLPALTTLERDSQPLPWSEDQLLVELLHDDSVVLGVDVEDEGQTMLAGHACVRRMLEAVWVLNIAVAPRFRRRGFGQELLVCAMAWGKARDLSSIWLEVRETNAGARALYEALGFEAVGRRPGYYPPIPPAQARETAILMKRALSGADHPLDSGDRAH